MLDEQSPWALHILQNASLILLSLLFLPLDTLILGVSYALQSSVTRQRVTRAVGFRPRIILVTGVGMAKGLAISRMFYQAGHTVIGADFEPHGIPVIGRFSKAITKFYSLQMPSRKYGSAEYIQDLLKIVRRDRIDLWVCCSGITSVVDDGQAMEIVQRRSDCKAIQFDVKTTTTLHEKRSFVQHAVSLGLPAPETYDVASRAAVHKVLQGVGKKRKQYVMKTAAADGTKRPAIHSGQPHVLPRRTMSQTYQEVSQIPISEKEPWILQQHIEGEEYCTHALVVNGEVQAFVACPTSEKLLRYEALLPSSALHRAMLRFTHEFAARSGPNLTGHLSIDFLIEENATERGFEKILYPIRCNPTVHTSVILLQDSIKEMAEKYLTALGPRRITNGNMGDTEIVTPKRPQRYYWIGHDLVTLVLHPALQVLTSKLSFSDFLTSYGNFLQHLFLWKDATFEIWDPVPWWWLYHVYWPGRFLSCVLQRKKWSRVDVSTTEIVEC